MVASIEYWTDKRLFTNGRLYTVKKTFSIISIENKTDAKAYSTVFMIDRNLFSVRFDFKGHVVLKLTVSDWSVIRCLARLFKSNDSKPSGQACLYSRAVGCCKTQN